MARNLPKDARKLIKYIEDNGGGSRRDGGEIVVWHPQLWRVRTRIPKRRKDASRKLYRLAKAVWSLINRHRKA